MVVLGDFSRCGDGVGGLRRRRGRHIRPRDSREGCREWSDLCVAPGRWGQGCGKLFVGGRRVSRRKDEAYRLAYKQKIADLVRSKTHAKVGSNRQCS